MFIQTKMKMNFSISRSFFWMVIHMCRYIQPDNEIQPFEVLTLCHDCDEQNGSGTNFSQTKGQKLVKCKYLDLLSCSQNNFFSRVSATG